MRGFDNQLGPDIYCSEITKSLILENSRLRSLSVNTSHLFSNVSVTLIPAYHCPGSVMFLIQSAGANVLYTGDVRCEQWFVDSLVKNPYILPFAEGLKQLDNVYMDTTFSYRGEPYIELLSNSEGISALLKIMEMYPEEVDFFFTDFTSGFEEVWTNAVVYLKEMLHVDPDVKSRLKILGNSHDFSNILYGKLNQTGRLHVCRKRTCSNSTFPVTIRQAINVSAETFHSLYMPVYLGSVDLSNFVVDGNIYTLKPTGERFILSQDGKYLLPSELRVLFSRHSSYSECINLVKLLKPKQIFPCTESEKSWKGGFQMQRVFGQYCSCTEFLFDNERTAIYGPGAISGPVSVANRWMIEQNEDFSFGFKGQYQVSDFNRTVSKDDRRFMKSCAYTYAIGNKLAGRGEHQIQKRLERKMNILKRHQSLESETQTSDEEEMCDNIMELLSRQPSTLEDSQFSPAVLEPPSCRLDTFLVDKYEALATNGGWFEIDLQFRKSHRGAAVG